MEFILFFATTMYTTCKAKRQYLFTCKVSRYCLLALHGSIIHMVHVVHHTKIYLSKCGVLDKKYETVRKELILYHDVCHNTCYRCHRAGHCHRECLLVRCHVNTRPQQNIPTGCYLGIPIIITYNLSLFINTRICLFCTKKSTI